MKYPLVRRRLTMTKNATLILLPMLLLAIAVPGAYADPTNSPKSISFTLTCGNAVYSVTSPSGPTPAALIVGSTNVSIAAIVDETITFTDSSGQQQTVEETFVMGPGHGTATGLQSSETTCTASPVTFQGLYGPVTITSVVTQFTTPHN
jgi:hypothetical protein